MFKFHRIANRVLSNPWDQESEACLSYVTIEVLNTWVNFSRAFYLSLILHPRTASSNQRIIVGTPGLNFDQAVGLAIRIYRLHAVPGASGVWHRRDEPTWHDPNVFMRVCNNIGCSNMPDINAAFSFGTRVFNDLPVFRNFYAHRNLQTEYAAKQLAPQYGIPATFRPSQILLARPLRRPQSLIFEWIDDIIFTIEYLCD